MKINKSSFYTTFFIVVLLSQMYIPSFKINVIFQISLLLMYFRIEKPTISIRLIKIIAPIILILLLGFVGALIYKNPIGIIIKDILHFIKPLQGILIGYFFFKIFNNRSVFVKTVIKTAFISALIHFFILIFFVDLASGTVNSVREFTKDNFLELIAIFFLGYNKLFFKEEIIFSKDKSRVIFIVLLISCVLYFSRTMIIGALIFFFTIKGFTKITKNSLKYIGLGLVAVSLFYAYLYSIKIDRSKPGLEAFMYKVKIAPEELFKTKIDRENHKELWDHWRGYEAKRSFALMDEKPLSYLFGTGYGSQVNLKFKAPLTADNKGMKFISELHNGYAYVLYKTGIIGLIFYLSFIFILYKKIYSKVMFETIFISALGFFYFFTTLTITGVFNSADTTVFILGALLFGLDQSNKKEEI